MPSLQGAEPGAGMNGACDLCRAGRRPSAAARRRAGLVVRAGMPPAGDEMPVRLLRDHPREACPDRRPFDAGRIRELVAEGAAMLVSVVRRITMCVGPRAVGMVGGRPNEIDAVRRHLMGRDAADHRKHHGSKERYAGPGEAARHGPTNICFF